MPGSGGVSAPCASNEMKAAGHVGPGQVRVEARPIPRIAAGELLLRVRGCGLCGSDLAKLRAAGRPPAVRGHEVTSWSAARL